MDEFEKEARQRTIEKLLRGLTWYTHDELSRMLTTAEKDGAELLSGWLREKRIFCVDGQITLYPQFQFDAQHSPYPVIKDVLACFSAKDAWAIAAWFFFPNGWIGQIKDGKEFAIAPWAVMDRAEDLLRAARNEHGTHFA
ncbi:hypothetical protein GJ699_00185 [Duganella sp. FT80W]|uniref:DUF2384 domain-containing protein n=1 Tax=Duganella guangzhouensis TaxID=2666084 RepID=A0A6I2KSH4_9BURK|nr:hypothetical protein [Duganella guangzhouensis]MRW88401.1 hypothetical protein [Duganella guangzhouensis]